KVKNQTYFPKIYKDYDEIGLASWYGSGFHCKMTANGEAFNKNKLSAAHKTLPLPSVVKVTNLNNNKSINVIVNDRGPFAANRIIDLSEKAAIELGIKSQGVAMVRVEFLSNETNDLMNKISSNKKIYYETKPKHKHEILVDTYKDQKTALTMMKKMFKLGGVHLLVKDNFYKLIVISPSKAKADILLKRLINLGYKNAKNISI
ncbi:MAG: septal ring lytic transglycosylase RlpA family protein, partial [Pseudomonadota bacterium]